MRGRSCGARIELVGWVLCPSFFIPGQALCVLEAWRWCWIYVLLIGEVGFVAGVVCNGQFLSW